MPNALKIVEYRGVENLVAAEVLTDDSTNGYTTGEVFPIAGVATVEKTTENSNEAHYYDNFPAIVVDATGNDTVTITASAIPLDVYAKITGQAYDAETGAVYEGNREPKYFAVGYIAEDTNDNKIYVWRLKGKFDIPGMTNNTKNAGTDANGQTLVYTGISTTAKFAKTGAGERSVVVDTGKELADVSTFFDAVTTPDTLQPKTAITYTVTNTLENCTSSESATTVNSGSAYSAVITADDGYTLGAVTVTMGGVNISAQAVTGGAISIPKVTGNIVITCTATA
ncbi:MAG: hypothetical protein K6F88_00350 [Ruminococcus sp.]|nr:hypothetical protein [Ruminococcus sp.]